MPRRCREVVVVAIDPCDVERLREEMRAVPGFDLNDHREEHVHQR